MLDQEVQNYMYIQKISYIWAINLILFATVVFLGIEQAGKGAEISNLENKIELLVTEKRDLSEGIFDSGSDTKIDKQSEELGFAKPTNIYYLKTEEVFAQR